MNNYFTTKKISLLALLTALMVVGRMAFQIIPNVQPMTAILLIVVFEWSFADASIVAILSLLISNLFLGMGPWTLGQVVAFFVILLGAQVIKKISNMPLIHLFYVIIAGFLYGFVISLVTYKMFGITAFWPYYLQGISFDALHAFGTLGFYVVLSPTFNYLFQKNKYIRELTHN